MPHTPRWQAFRPLLKVVHQKQRGRNAKRKPHDLMLMFKVRVLQALYNPSADQAEFQVGDRLCFQPFLGLSPEDTVPDVKTLWSLREQLVRHGLIDELFRHFEEQSWASGLMPEGGQIVAVSLIDVPKNRNTRDENKQIRAGTDVSGLQYATAGISARAAVRLLNGRKPAGAASGEK